MSTAVIPLDLLPEIESIETKITAKNVEFERLSNDMNIVSEKKVTISLFSSQLAQTEHQNYISRQEAFLTAKSEYEKERERINSFLGAVKTHGKRVLPTLVEFSKLYNILDEEISKTENKVKQRIDAIEQLTASLKQATKTYSEHKQKLSEDISELNGISKKLPVKSYLEKMDHIKNAFYAEAERIDKIVKDNKLEEHAIQFPKTFIDTNFDELTKSGNEASVLYTSINQKIEIITNSPALSKIRDAGPTEPILPIADLTNMLDKMRTIKTELGQFDSYMKTAFTLPKGSNPAQIYTDYMNNSLNTLSTNIKRMNSSLKSMDASQAILREEELRKGFERRTNLFETMHKKHEAYSEKALIAIVVLTGMTLILLAILLVLNNTPDSSKEQMGSIALAIFISTRVSIALVVAWTVSFLVTIRATNQRQAILYKDRALGLSIMEELIVKFKDAGKADILFDKIMIGYLEFQRSGFDTEEGKGVSSNMLSTAKQFGETIGSLMPIIQALREIAPVPVPPSDAAGSTTQPSAAGTKSPPIPIK